jgi:hypothetical protein
MPALPQEEYYVGWICALRSEMAVAIAMLDDRYPMVETQDAQDHNNYALGRMHGHNAVIACLPARVYGIAPATAVVKVLKDMLRTLKSLRFELMFGIGGGIPCPEKNIDIRLGDVIISQPSGTSGGVIQYNRGISR